MIKLIWAMDKNGIIGKNNKLPWRIKEELQHFYRETKFKTILMGRKTYESLPNKNLINRKIILISRSDKNSKALNSILDNQNSNVVVVNNLIDFLKKYYNTKEDLYICGGASIYQQSIPFANELIISEIKNSYDGDSVFPKFDITKFELYKKIDYNDFIVKYYKKI